jgi:RsiW-degrading membrane proteinase PrsW (M82 family)
MLQLVAPPPEAIDSNCNDDVSGATAQHLSLYQAMPAEEVGSAWEINEQENPLGIGVPMQLALSQRMGTSMRKLVGGIGAAIITISMLVTVLVSSFIGTSALTEKGAASLVVALTVPFIPALAIVLLANFMDRFEHEPWFLRLAAFLWGAIIAVPPARIIEYYAVLWMQGWLSEANILQNSLFLALNAGIPEEAFKGLGLLLFYLFLRNEFDNVTDGIVYGALIGAGFALVENFDYFARNSREFLWILIIGRVVLGWLNHSTFIICFGIALGQVRHTQERWRSIVVPLVGYLIAVMLHSIFDFVDNFANGMMLADPKNATVTTVAIIAIVANLIPPFITQLTILSLLIKSLAHEAAVIREYLAAEVSRGVVTVDEYLLLQNSFQRTKAERRALRQSGYKQWRRVRELYQAEIGLAFRKWHVSMGDPPQEGEMQPEDVYRQHIRRLRQEIMALEVKKN